MGFDAHAVDFLVESLDSGVSLDACLTLGRQGLHVSPARLQQALSRRGRELLSPAQLVSCFLPPDGFPGPCADALLIHLGARLLDTLDASAYEGASIVHDLSTPVPPDLDGRYSCILDCGTLEHVFDFPVALRSVMRMLQPGGHFIAVTPCNNFCGHGLYQFSPELFWSLFCKPNGFEIEALYVTEVPEGARWFQAANPAELGWRVEFTNFTPTYLLLRARKVRYVPPSEIRVHQSDYAAQWASAGSNTQPVLPAAPAHKTLRARLRSRLKPALRDLWERVGRRLWPPFGPPYFRQK